MTTATEETLLKVRQVDPLRDADAGPCWHVGCPNFGEFMVRRPGVDTRKFYACTADLGFIVAFVLEG